jgi:hypothetical protein
MAASNTSSPTEPAPGLPLAPTVHIRFLIAVVFSLSVIKGLRMPNLWAATHMTFNYSQGFIRRGLFGQVLRIFGEDHSYHYRFLALCAAILLVLAGTGLFMLLRRMLASDRGDRGLQAAVLVLGASPGVVFLAHETGYLDYAGLVAVPAFILWASRSRKRFLIFHVAAALSIVLALIHESMIVMFFPAMLFTMICHVATRGAGQPRRTRLVLAAHVVLATSIALAASLVAGSLGSRSPELLRALQESVARHADFPLRGDAFDAIRHSWRENLLVIIPRHFSHPTNYNYLLTGLVVALPGLAFLGTYGVRLLGRLDTSRRLRWVLTGAFLTATVAPLLLNFVGWDSARWNAVAFMASFYCLGSLRLYFHPPTPDVDARPTRVDEPWMLTFAAVAIVTGLCSNYSGFLFDDNVVRWFPFKEGVDTALEVIKSGFKYVPR